MTLEKQIVDIAKRAKDASKKLAVVGTKKKNEALLLMAKGLEDSTLTILDQNAVDIKNAKKKKLQASLIDRLALNEKRIQDMIDSLKAVAELEDPVGNVYDFSTRPNGLRIKKMTVPLGVIGIIYESRPNVTSDCVALTLKSGNSVILKGGSEAINSNRAIFEALHNSIKDSGLPDGSINFIDSIKRETVNVLLKQNNYVDVIIPRGGEALIQEVTLNSLIPVIKHYKGVCHTYVDEFADLNMAHAIAMNAKVQRPGVCNAMETLLVHEDVAPRYLPVLANELKKSGVEIRGCEKTRIILKNIKAAKEEDWHEEYLDLILAVRVVSSLTEAIEHIHKYGSNHSDSIITDEQQNAERFLREIDSACVYHNASTRFTDGHQFGMGAEIGISTDKLHARGPMALSELTTYKYVIYGTGQVRS